MSLMIREMQIKITLRYCLTPVRMATIYKSTNNKRTSPVHCWWECRLVKLLWKAVWS